MTPKITKSSKVRGYLKMFGIKSLDVANFAGVEASTVRSVLCGTRPSNNIRNATIELLRFADPKIAREIESIWPKGERLAA